MGTVCTTQEWVDTLLVLRQVRDNPLPPGVIETISSHYPDFSEQGWIDLRWNVQHFLLPWSPNERNVLYTREEN